MTVEGIDFYNMNTTGGVAMTIRGQADNEHIPCVLIGGVKKSYGFYPQMKAEGMAFKEEKSGAIVIGTNPGYQNGVVIVYGDNSNNSRRSNHENQ